MTKEEEEEEIEFIHSTMASLTAAATGLSGNPFFLSTQTLKSHSYPSIAFFRENRAVFKRWVIFNTAIKAMEESEMKTTTGGGSPGLYSAQTFELNVKNVDFVLEDVRPYLISDGGNVDVVSVEDGVISLQLQGACGSCPSSTTTMKMGIERVLKEKFGDAVKDIRQVFDEQQKDITVEAVNGHLDILRPAIKNYGGSVEVVSIDGGDCHVKFQGPESIGSGVRAAIKEKFPDIVNVIFTG